MWCRKGKSKLILCLTCLPSLDFVIYPADSRSKRIFLTDRSVILINSDNSRPVIKGCLVRKKSTIAWLVRNAHLAILMSRNSDEFVKRHISLYHKKSRYRPFKGAIPLVPPKHPLSDLCAKAGERLKRMCTNCRIKTTVYLRFLSFRGCRFERAFFLALSSYWVQFGLG